MRDNEIPTLNVQKTIVIDRLCKIFYYHGRFDVDDKELDKQVDVLCYSLRKHNNALDVVAKDVGGVTTYEWRKKNLRSHEPDDSV
jgi:hypothetical protein